MVNKLQAIASLFFSKKPHTRRRPRRRLELESFEAREVPATITLGGRADNTLYEVSSAASPQLSDGAGQHFFVGRTNQGSNDIRRGAIKFDLSGVPAGATISGVTLMLNVSQTTSGAQDVTLHRALMDWGEGTSTAPRGEGDGGPATTGDVTWFYTFFNTLRWTTPGGDFAATPSASTSVGSVGSYQWTGTGLVADVQQWVNNPATNFGWILTGNEATGRTSKQFDTAANSTATSRPALTIVYTASAPNPNASIVGRDQSTGFWWVSTSTGSVFNNALAAGATWDPGVTWVNVMTGDFTGSGKTDFVGREQATGNWWVSVPNGNGQFTTTRWGAWAPGLNWVDVMVGDFTGDGKADIAGRLLETGQWFVAVSNGTSFQTTVWGAWDPAATWSDVQVGDLTGSHKADLVGRNHADGDWFAAMSNGSAFTNTKWASWAPDSATLTWVDVHLADFNGDGKMDLVGRWQQTGQVWVSLSNGTSASPATLWTTWDPTATWVDVMVGDFNGDGKADLAGRRLQSGQWQVSTSTGSAFTNAIWAVWSTAATWTDVTVGDFNGDGKADIVGRTTQDGDWWVGLSNGTSFTTSHFGAWSPHDTWVSPSVAHFG